MRRTNHVQHTVEVAYQHHIFVAGYIETQFDPGRQPDTHRRLIELRAYCGRHWGNDPTIDARTSARTEALLAQLDAAAQALGLEVRAGVFEEA